MGVELGPQPSEKWLEELIKNGWKEEDKRSCSSRHNNEGHLQVSFSLHNMYGIAPGIMRLLSVDSYLASRLDEVMYH